MSTSVATPKPSPMEDLKRQSRQLRGTIGEELSNQDAAFSKPAQGLIKFHGMYQQDDRDLRKQQSAKSFSLMVRVSIPGGAVTAEQYRVLDLLADTVGDGTLRITSRGGIQYHHVAKQDVRGLIQAVIDANLSTLAACGDVVRNVVYCASPVQTAERRSLLEYARLLNGALKPKTSAYAEIWLDGEKAVSIEPQHGSLEEDAVDPLYGDTYLPRKFKVAFAYEGENTTDIYSQDLGFVGHFAQGELEGFTVTAGGGLGQSNGVKQSHPRLADEICFIAREHMVETAKAVVQIHRDFGNRSNRKLARLKYVLDERGVEWFREELQRRVSFQLQPARKLEWTRQSDFLGWHEQGAGRWFYGMRVISGRIGGKQRDAIRAIVAEIKPEVRFTAQQNILFVDLSDADKARFDEILAEYGQRETEMKPLFQLAMACPALPTCGLALSESERALPGMLQDVQLELDQLGLSDEPIFLRTSGCPNGCSRPYTAEIGIVGQSVNLYSLYLGGSHLGTRLSDLYAHQIPGEQLAGTLRPLLNEWKANRAHGESFGDYCQRTGVATLHARHGVPGRVQ